MKWQAKDRKMLEQIIRYCEKIETTIHRFGANFESFTCDPDYVDSVSMNILQIGELAGSLSADYVESTKTSMDWRAIKGMRNIFAHDYGSMDIERTWYTATTDVPELKAFCIKQLEAIGKETTDV